MSDDPKAPTPDPFDPKSLSISGNPAAEISVKRALVQVQVRRPSKQEFVRVHSDPDFRAPMAILELKSDNQVYLVAPDVALAVSGETRMVTLKTAINRQGTPFLWPVPLPDPAGRSNSWHETHRQASERAEKKWIRMISNMSAGAYDVWEADAEIADPAWPEHDFRDYLKVAFGNGRLIDRVDHPVLQQLLGRA